MARRIANENYEREKQRQANLTALSAIGPQRKRKFDSFDDTSHDASGPAGLGFSSVRGVDGIESRLAYATADQFASPSSGLLLSTSASASSNFSGGSDNQDNFTSLYPLTIGGVAISSGGMGSAGSANSSSGSAGPSTGLADGGDGVVSGSSFNLASTLRVRRANLRDMQLVFSKDARLRRSRTYYKTFWRIP
ncbi:unnamed protein product [Protopolystoma xenopodis]|uniref:Uncharacterized protein n=1 Tax=Protopolystoma xenopodis TaxID=117903 RepID=A0A3S5CGY2_9PLAT|nr:unnamed protein product [Protopolystoma xenopodis]